ncbi:PEP/pyruvate-binding domain-containing protein [Hymenobacter fodinae]|uniref:Phosphoenolpyruvate synthase n=1 Tax=Hymenobacter fodinae TaxID=2510796 RepID=A0A4Z0P4P7_9BACT|nr:PEP/pyruvate-binding domain-containing protein [Hymenobacter fodinae]TGE06644.1 phosphoenolpyruvate synthase [Hymenobacter fodinae]
MLLHHDTPLSARRAYTPGGKAAGLYQLREFGLPVPPFLVVPAETFEAVLQGLPLTAAGLEQRAAQLRVFRLPAAEEAALGQVLTSWGFPAQPVVVRSSVADEDGATAAFAGLMDTFLNLTTLPEVLAALGQCAASAYSARAVAYRQQKGLPLAARPAVVVQQQLAANVSGVLFTTYPEYPLYQAIHAVRGFGEGLVGGHFDPQETYLRKTTGEVCGQRLPPQPEQFGASGLEAGLARVPVSTPAQAQACLTAAQLAELHAAGEQLERLTGRAQDVEFVVADGRLWLVQMRPITQAIPEVVVYDNSNIQESYCGVTTPLTFSFAQRAYATVYRQTMRVLGLPPAVVAAHEPVVTQLLGLVQGRIYYHINHWYQGLLLLPSFRQNKADMERMMGLEEPVDLVQSRVRSLPERLRMLPRLLLNLGRLLRAFQQLPQRIAAFQADFQHHYERFYQLPLASLSGAELLAEKMALDAGLLEQWTTPIVNDFRVMMANGRALRLLRRWGLAQPEEFLHRYLSGDEDLPSAQISRRMQELAQQVKAHPGLLPLLLELPPDVHARVEQLAPGFKAAVTEFIRRYGDRTVGELKLETHTMRLAPRIFYQYLRNYLGSVEGPRPAPVATTALKDAAEAELAHALLGHSWWARRQTHKALRQLRAAIHARETLRLERTRLFGMYRALYLAAGEWLVQQGGLATSRDVFYLTEAEITGALQSQPPAGMQELVESRRAEFARYSQAEVPARVTVPAPPVFAENQEDAVENPDQLRGTGCVPGVVEGEILVIRSPEDNLDVAGKIVCALRTDPGWAVLFPNCRAVVIEKGSALSHSVILLRELGIPTIINVPGLTRRLQSGQHLRFDGGRGELQVLSSADDPVTAGSPRPQASPAAI